LENIQSLRKDKEVYQNGPNRVIAGTEPGLLGVTRKKLLLFLEKSKYYVPEKMLSKFSSEELYEERALLLSRIGEHEQALKIYANKLKDYQMAEAYCAKHYNADVEGARDVYLSLLRVYLKPEDGAKGIMLQPALELLDKYYAKMDTAKAMELLPLDTSISKLFALFTAILRENTKTRRNNQIVKNLLKAENFQVREQQIRAKSRVIKIPEDKMCPYCNKKLGSSAFVCNPNGVVMHYACFKNQEVKNSQQNVMS